MTRTRQLLGVLLLTLTLAACGAPTDNSGMAPAFELKLYHVPVAQSDAIANQLTKVLVNSGYLVGTKSHTEMNVSQPFPGAVLVLAPARLQPSIGAAIDALNEAAGKSAPAARQKTEPPAVRIRAWIIQAKAGDGVDAAALDALEPALKALRHSLGPSHFVLNDFVAMATNADQGGQITTSQGHTFRFTSTVNAAGAFDLKVDYEDPMAQTFRDLRTRVAVQPDEYVVLAQAPSTGAASAEGDATLMTLLVIRADRLPSLH